MCTLVRRSSPWGTTPNLPCHQSKRLYDYIMTNYIFRQNVRGNVWHMHDRSPPGWAPIHHKPATEALPGWGVPNRSKHYPTVITVISCAQEWTCWTCWNSEQKTPSAKTQAHASHPPQASWHDITRSICRSCNEQKSAKWPGFHWSRFILLISPTAPFSVHALPVSTYISAQETWKSLKIKLIKPKVSTNLHLAFSSAVVPAVAGAGQGIKRSQFNFQYFSCVP